MTLYLRVFFFFFVELKTIQVYKSSIYMCVYVCVCVLIGKTKKNSIRFQFWIQLESNFAPHVPSNQNFKIFLNQVSQFSVKIGFQLEFNFTAHVPSNWSFLIFVPNELI